MDYEMEDHLEGSHATGGLIPQAQIMEVLHNLNVSHYSFNNPTKTSQIRSYEIIRNILLSFAPFFVDIGP